jgi:DNA-binding CsgD family transcriptional regulator
VLLVSRNVNLLPWYKTYFEGLGFIDVHVTDKDRDGLNLLIRELKPRRVFMASDFYSIGTPFMVGVMHEKFPKLSINVASTSYYPDELATYFIFHGANSYVNLLDGVEEFKNGIIQITKGIPYISPAVKPYVDGIDEWPDCRLKVGKREREILLMVCNGYSWKKMMDEMQISEYTLHYHIKELKKIFHVHSRDDLVKVALCLDLVKKSQLCFHENKKLVDSLPDWVKAQMKINKLTMRSEQ